MAIRVELWTDGHLAGGTEAWWDDMDIALPADRNTKYPLLSRVDSYGDVIFEREEMESLITELRAFMAESSSGGPAQLASRLVELCIAALAARNAQLRFLGD